MLLLLIRHGQSQANVEAVIQGADDPLTERGRRQATVLAGSLAEQYQISHMYASSLIRAAETATIVGERLGLTPTLLPGLAEIDAGVAAGRTWADWREEDPARAERWSWEHREATDGWDGGENGAMFSERIFAALDEIVLRHAASDETIAVVTHGGVLSWFAARLYGDPLDVRPARRAGFTNCSVTEIHVEPDGSMTPGRWNVGCDPDATT